MYTAKYTKHTTIWSLATVELLQICGNSKRALFLSLSWNCNIIIEAILVACLTNSC